MPTKAWVCDSCGRNYNMDHGNHRYRCQQCVDFDLCAPCMRSQVAVKSHSSSHPMTLFAVTYHRGVVCDLCKTYDFAGTRWRCLQCINFDTCSVCYPAHSHHHAQRIDSCVPSITDLFQTMQISSGASSPSGRKKHYCGKQVLKCSCCDGRCGPTNGCSCLSCQELDMEKYSSKLNRVGDPSKKGETGKHYCGKAKLSCGCCNTYCGPTNGCNCNDCAKLDVDEYYHFYTVSVPASSLDGFFKRWWQKPGIGVPRILKSVFLIGSSWDKLQSLAGSSHARLLFHGTKASCLLTCGTCSACKIKSEGFKLTKAGSNTNFLRFGKGLYFTPNTCKAHAYTGNGPYRAMIITMVILGNSYVLTDDSRTLSSPPTGYHSIYGKPGNTLNWPEFVVYSEANAKPAAIIIYSI